MLKYKSGYSEPVNEEARVRLHIGPCEICCARSGTGRPRSKENNMKMNLRGDWA